MGLRKEDFIQEIRQAEVDAQRQEAQLKRDLLHEKELKKQPEKDPKFPKEPERRKLNLVRHRTEFPWIESLGLLNAMEALSESTGRSPVFELSIEDYQKGPDTLIYGFVIRSRRGRVWTNTGESVYKGERFVRPFGRDHATLSEGGYEPVYGYKYVDSPVSNLEDICILIINPNIASMTIDVDRYPFKEHKLLKGNIFFPPQRVGEAEDRLWRGPLTDQNPRLRWDPQQPPDNESVKKFFVKAYNFLKSEKQEFSTKGRK